MQSKANCAHGSWGVTCVPHPLHLSLRYIVSTRWKRQVDGFHFPSLCPLFVIAWALLLRHLAATATSGNAWGASSVLWSNSWASFHQNSSCGLFVHVTATRCNSHHRRPSRIVVVVIVVLKGVIVIGDANKIAHLHLACHPPYSLPGDCGTHHTSPCLGRVSLADPLARMKEMGGVGANGFNSPTTSRCHHCWNDLWGLSLIFW